MQWPFLANLMHWGTERTTRLDSTETPCPMPRKSVLETAASLIACGIDPKRSIIYRQSEVSRVCIDLTDWAERLFRFQLYHHTQLAWLLGTMTTVQKVAHIPTYKVSSNVFPLACRWLSFRFIVQSEGRCSDSLGSFSLSGFTISGYSSLQDDPPTDRWRSGSPFATLYLHDREVLSLLPKEYLSRSSNVG